MPEKNEAIQAEGDGAEVRNVDKSNTKTVVAQEFVNLYCNSATFSFTNWDMSMVLGELFGEREEDGKTLIVQKARVTMPLSHAKVFYKILGDNLRGFEKQFGKIQLLGSAKKYDPDAPADDTADSE